MVVGGGCGTNTPARGLEGCNTISAPAQPSSSCARQRSSVSGAPPGGVGRARRQRPRRGCGAACQLPRPNSPPTRISRRIRSNVTSPRCYRVPPDGLARRADHGAEMAVAAAAGGPAGLIWTRLPVARDSWTARVTARLRQHCHPRGPAARSRARVPSSASLTATTCEDGPVPGTRRLAPSEGFEAALQSPAAE